LFAPPGLSLDGGFDFRLNLPVAGVVYGVTVAYDHADSTAVAAFVPALEAAKVFGMLGFWGADLGSAVVGAGRGLAAAAH